jgi:hypothetical protein
MQGRAVLSAATPPAAARSQRSHPAALPRQTSESAMAFAAASSFSIWSGIPMVMRR